MTCGYFEFSSQLERGRRESNLNIFTLNLVKDNFIRVITPSAVDSSLLVVFETIMEPFRSVIIWKSERLMETC